jgi:hypothetical protein
VVEETINQAAGEAIGNATASIDSLTAAQQAVAIESTTKSPHHR